MIYFSIDLETTGIDWNEDSIVEFGAILEDTNQQFSFEEIPKFNVLIKHPKYIGTPYALSLHSEIFKELAKPPGESLEKIISYKDLGTEFRSWALQQNKQFNFLNTSELMVNSKISINVAGKNFGTFDMRFLENLENFNDCVAFNKRIIDPSILYFDESLDSELPNLSICKQRAGINDLNIAHRSIDDAWDVIQVLRGKMYVQLERDDVAF